MELTEHRCNRCGAELEQQSDTRWKCRYCGCSYDDNTAVQNTKNMREMFDEAKREIVNNLRRNLYDATNAEYISSADVKNACVELKKYLPEDFRANFFEIAVGHNERKLTSAIRKIDVAEHYEDIENIVQFLIKSLQPDFLLELNNLIERAFKAKDLRLFEKYATEISVQAEKVQLGVYETKLPREVFVAYSSKDMDKVSELVEILEGQGLKCFVAARNLRHGKGAVENYDKALKEAIDHCKSFVFVSTTNSRSFSCDALEIEIPYVQKRDTENAPAEYRNNYAAIPHKFKKPRVEYRVESSKGFNAADEITKEFFDGYEWVLSPSEVAVRIMKQLVATPESSGEHKKDSANGKKYCSSCGTETAVSSNVCPNCGKSEFVNDVSDFIKLKNQRDIEDRRSREQAAGVHMGPKKSKSLAVILAFFLGIFGVDQFYLGRTKRGVGRIIATLLSCGIIGSIWGIVDCVRMATGSLSIYPDVTAQKKKSKKGIAVLAVLAFIAVIVIIYVASGGNIVQNDPVYNNGISVETQDIYYIGNLGEITVDKFEGWEMTAPDDLEDKWEDTWDDNNNGEMEDITGDYGSLHYTFTHDGILTISGEGEIPSYDEMNSYPWNEVSYKISTLVIENGVTAIGDYAFRELRWLNNVSLPESLTHIGSYAFQDSQMSAIDAPGVTEIGEGAFANCSNLQTASFPKAQVVGDSAFASCMSLKTVDFTSVVTIKDNAFNYCNALSEMNIPNCTSIGMNAFTSCSSLQTVTADSLVSVGYEAFQDTYIRNQLNYTQPLYIGKVLVNVSNEYSGALNILDGTVSIAESALQGCNSITSVLIPTSVKNIGNSAFYDAYYLETIIYFGSEDEWNGITKGENWNTDAGYYTSARETIFQFMNGEYDSDKEDTYTQGLTFSLDGSTNTYTVSGYSGTDAVVTIPSTYLSLPVTKISSAFNSNRTVTEVNIPASIKEIGESAFSSMTKLEKVNIADESQLETISNNAFMGCTKLTAFTVPASVKTIEYNAFYECTGLKTLKFAENSQIETIGDRAFQGCAITDIELPVTLTSMQSSAFSSCEIVTATVPAEMVSYIPSNNLVTLTIRGGEKISSLGGNETLETVIIGDSITTIGDNAFDGCQSLKTITFGANLTTIGSRAFADCNAIESIVIPEGVTTMKSSCFASCTSLKSATLPTTLTDVGSDMFSSCNSLETVTMPANAISGVISTSYYSEGKTSIVTVNITSGITIPSRAFSGCVKLRNVNLCEGIMIIGDYAFENCLSLLSIELPSTVSGITSSAFSGATSLVEIINHSTDIGKADFDPDYDAADPEKEGRYVIHEGESIVKYVGDYAFITRGDENYLISYLGSSSEITLPETYNGETYAIRARAFEGRTDLTEINIVGAHTIGDYAFSNSTVKEVTVGDTVTNIGIRAFEYCSSLKAITFGTGLKEIGLYAFESCSALDMITIPANVDVIGRGAFSNCDNLLSVVFSDLGTFNIYDVYEVEPTTPYAEYQAIGNSTTNAKYLRDTYCYYEWVRQVTE